MIYDLSNGGFWGWPVSGKKTAKVCWYPLNCKYSLISSFMIRFSFDKSGLLGGVSFKVLKIYALILALICDKTPLSYSVYFSTSLSSLIEAISKINNLKTNYL